MIGILSTDNIADLKPLGDRLLVEVRSPTRRLAQLQAAPEMQCIAEASSSERAVAVRQLGWHSAGWPLSKAYWDWTPVLAG